MISCGGPRLSSEVVAAALRAPNTGERGAVEEQVLMSGANDSQGVSAVDQGPYDLQRR